MIMHIVIMGCGRVGSTLAHILEDQGHTVAVIDQDVEAFRKLRPGFHGSKITGIGFDRDVLIAARVARESFGVQRVAARIYDPRRAEVYQRLGIPTVATVRWTADQMLRRLLPDGVATLWRDPTGSLVLAELSCCDAWLGEKVSELEAAAGTRIVFISRLGEALMPGPATVLQQGEVLHEMAREDDLKQIASVFAKRAAPGQGGHV